jgi:hypothetical protein
MWETGVRLSITKESVTDLEVLGVLVIRLLKRDLDRLVKEIKPVELWDEG